MLKGIPLTDMVWRGGRLTFSKNPFSGQKNQETKLRKPGSMGEIPKRRKLRKESSASGYELTAYPRTTLSYMCVEHNQRSTAKASRSGITYYCCPSETNP